MELQIVATLGVGILTTALGIFMKLGFNGIHRQFDGMQNQFNGMQKQFDGIQNQFDAINTRLTDIHNDLNNIKTDVRATNQNLIDHLAQHDQAPA